MSNKSCRAIQGAPFMLYYFFSCDKRFLKKVRKSKRNEFIFQSLNPSRTLFIYEGLFFLTFKAGLTEISQKNINIFSPYFQWLICHECFLKIKERNSQKYRKIQAIGGGQFRDLCRRSFSWRYSCGVCDWTGRTKLQSLSRSPLVVRTQQKLDSVG